MSALWGNATEMYAAYREPDAFQALLDARDAARDAHESYVGYVTEEGTWCTTTSRAAHRLHARYLELQEQVDAEIEAERAREAE